MTVFRPLPVARRRVVGAGGLGLALLAVARPARAAAAVRLVSPPGRLQALQDYPYWVAKTLGYFGDLETTLDPGPPEATAGTKPVDRGRADLGVATPGLLALGLQQGMRLVSVWQAQALDPLALAFRKGEAPAGLKAMGGKTVLLDSAARVPLCDALFAQAGLQPDTVTYVAAGSGWARQLAQGKGDAALGWDGLRALWAAQGLGFDYLPGRVVSRLPGACLVARARDAADPAARPVLARYLRGWAMALAFADRNPRAAAAIAVHAVPAAGALVQPAPATAAVLQLGAAARGDMAKRQGWGWHDPDAWALLLRTSQDLGQISAPIPPARAMTNDFVADANAFDAGQVNADADRYTLPPAFAQVDLDALRAAP